MSDPQWCTTATQEEEQHCWQQQQAAKIQTAALPHAMDEPRAHQLHQQEIY
jgi:hypothetical protein